MESASRTDPAHHLQSKCEEGGSRHGHDLDDHRKPLGR